MVARWCSPTTRGGRRDDGAAWRSAAIAPNRPRTAIGSKTRPDKLTNSSWGQLEKGDQHGRSSVDRLRRKRNTSRSWNDGADLPAHLLRQGRHALVVRQSDPVLRGADRGRLLRPIYRYRLGGHENAGGYARHQDHRQ